ncbi:MAG TPA: DUF5655 domain-containing protein [Actinotalea sp.]|nr:DUF5655 domain-containing protein [Actinotalea sp.]
MAAGAAPGAEAGDRAEAPTTQAPGSARELFAGHPVAVAVHDVVLDALRRLGPVSERVTVSQVAFRRARGFAFLWRPDQYLHGDHAPVVLTVALGRRDRSPRWKEVVHPSERQWIHHLEVRDVAEIDDEVLGWLAEAADRA